MALFRDVASWPLVLCGPMLRKVTTTHVSVFVALKHPALVTLTITEPNISTVERKSTPQRTVALGRNLHVLVVTADLTSAPLETGTLFQYTLNFVCDDALLSNDLEGLGLLHGSARIGLADGEQPTFALPASSADLQLYHCSCRLAHGEGLDALPLVEAALRQSENDPALRPHQLVLTGDQIYADDVTPVLGAACTALGRELLGWSPPESIPYGLTSAAGEITLDAPLPLADVPPFRAALKRRWGRYPHPDFRSRGDFIASQTSFTSNTGEFENHLLFLGEFFAMYLLAWSPELWPREQGWPSPPPVADVFAAPLPFVGFRREMEEKAAADRPALAAFVSSLERARRVLANVPTAMIFDDHEVADDWNINAWWHDNVMQRPAGRRVVRNALLAYAVFQDWGNQPEDYVKPASGAAPYGRQILEELAMPGAPSGPPTGVGAHPPPLTTAEPPRVQTHPEQLETLLDFASLAEIERVGHRARAQRKIWDFTWVWPSHQLLCLDTRTWRFFQRGGEVLPAELISASSLAEQLDPGRIETRPLFVVSATPVFGAKPVTWGKEVAQTADDFKNWSVVSMAEFDFEEWGNNLRGLANVAEALALCRPAAVLSGDVHYSFSSSVNCEVRRPNRQTVAARMAQFCCSPLKNHLDNPRYGEIVAHLDMRIEVVVCTRDSALLDRLAAHVAMRRAAGGFGLPSYLALHRQIEQARRSPRALRLKLDINDTEDADVLNQIETHLADGVLLKFKGHDVRSTYKFLDPVTWRPHGVAADRIIERAAHFVYGQNSIGQVQYLPATPNGPIVFQHLWFKLGPPGAIDGHFGFSLAKHGVVLQ